MFVLITEVTIECASLHFDEHDPRFCEECYVYYQSYPQITFPDSALLEKSSMVFEIEFISNSIEETNDDSAIGQLFVKESFVNTVNQAPEYQRWIIDKVKAEMFDSGNWDCNPKN